MKSLIIGSCIVLGSFTGIRAQDKSLREFRNSYAGKTEIAGTRLSALSLGLIRLAVSLDRQPDEDTKAARLLLRKVHKVKIFSIDNPAGSVVKKEDIARLKNNLLEKEHFDVLMECRQQGNQVYILNKGKDDELGRVVILVEDENDLQVVNLQTSLRISDINYLIQRFASR
ncbi:DUF4252 domain-containing protein [Chitinophaga solisilvae]|uniref:DUF4252 domain-containing protein n=1 Tax=Chitinophaga solisilvae TaxID=1233460 RepID=A0A3S1AYF4_9BACT|nr:DUF4252 domain-containing protein [Chitinophaga solisilvae]NSL86556.1 DUF4252 domain-containing protein [Chitinophaga solisilvae]